MKGTLHGVAVCVVAIGCQRSAPSPGPRATAGNTDAAAATRPSHETTVLGDATVRDSGARDTQQGAHTVVVLRVRVKNVDTRPLLIRTNPDSNEMLRVHLLNIADDRSDRAALFAQGRRVSLFPIGQMPRCDADAGAGYGGLGQAGSITLAPGESFEAATWDGLTRAEILHPTLGVCATESQTQPGRYRVYLDQPQFDGKPRCTRAVFRWPLVHDGGTGETVIELECQNALPTPAAPAAPAAAH